MPFDGTLYDERGNALPPTPRQFRALDANAVDFEGPEGAVTGTHGGSVIRRYGTGPDAQYAYYSPERDRVWTLRNIYALVRLIFGDVLPEYIGGVLKELERGRLTRYVDLCSRAGTDPVVRRSYEIRRDAIASRAYAISPGKCDADREVAAEGAVTIATQALDHIQSWEECAMRALDGSGTGIAIHELMWERQGGLWWPRPVPVLTREIWLDGDWTPMVRDAQYVFHRVVDHPGKFWVHSPATQPGTFADQGCFRSVIWPWFFKVWATKFWMIASERYGSPLVVGEIGAGEPGNSNQASEGAKGSLLADIQKLTVDSVAVVAGGTKITTYPAQGASSSALFKELCDYWDRQIILGIMGSPDLLIPGQNGSRVATVARDGLRLEGSGTDAKLFWGSVARDVVRPTMRYNGLPTYAPIPIMETVFERDIAPITPLAVSCRAVTVDELRESLNLEEWGEERGGNAIAMLPAGETVSPTGKVQDDSGAGGTPPAAPFPPAGKQAPQPPAGAQHPLGGMPDLQRSQRAQPVRASVIPRRSRIVRRPML